MSGSERQADANGAQQRVDANEDRFKYALHRQYIRALDADPDTLESVMADHLRMGGLYWGLTALGIMENDEPSSAGADNTNSGVAAAVSKGCSFEWMQRCWNERSLGYSANIGHDPHVTSTLYAVLLSAVRGDTEKLDADAITKGLRNLQTSDGSFMGEFWGEVDGRFMYSALCALKVLNRLDSIDREKAVNWIRRCRNSDGAFGSVPGGESHAAYTFCCVMSLALLEALHEIDADRLGFWLAERQLSNCGGFNGRPEKAPDVCYSWWIYSTLVVIGRQDWIDRAALSDFILESQDLEDGGIADRPGDVPDVFHTFFGVASLSLLSAVPGLKRIHPVYGLPVETIEKLRLPPLLDLHTFSE